MDFLIRKIMGLLFPPLFCMIVFGISFFFGQPILFTLVYTLVALLGSVAFSHWFLLNDSFFQVLQKQGYLVWSLDSAGVMVPAIAKSNPPFLKAFFKDHEYETVVDRDIVHYMAAHVNAEFREFKVKEKEYMAFIVEKEKYMRARFGHLQLPMILFNRITETFYTKEYLAKMEVATYAHHLLIYQNRKLEEIIRIFRDFQRYVAEQFRPKNSLLDSPWVRIILIVAVLGLLAYFAWPHISKILLGASDTVGKAAGPLSSGVS